MSIEIELGEIRQCACLLRELGQVVELIMRPQPNCCNLAQGDLNLNICEAHAFNTHDRFSLDVFVVNGWHGEVTISL